MFFSGNILSMTNNLRQFSIVCRPREDDRPKLLAISTPSIFLANFLSNFSLTKVNFSEKSIFHNSEWLFRLNFGTKM